MVLAGRLKGCFPGRPNVMKPTFKSGDILAVRGKGFFARGILAATGNTVSHVGMVVGDTPVIVIEALLRVKTRPIEDSVADAEKAYLLQDLSLSTEKRDTIVKRACQFSAADYGWADIVLQLANAVFRTTWFTDHLTFGFLNQFPICSYLVAESYETIGLTFGKQKDESITPADIYNFARQQPTIYTVTKLDIQDFTEPL
jgi:hypothetical protein